MATGAVRAIGVRGGGSVEVGVAIKVVWRSVRG